MSESESFEVAAVRVALREMFRGRHFNICTVDSCLTALQITPPKAEYDALRVLHCINWSEMGQALRQATIERTLALFRHPRLDLALLDETPLASASGGGIVRRLLGGRS